MATASLTDIPSTPHELEDYVAALFHSSQFFTEKHIIERDVTEILELDVVATSYEQDDPSRILIEAKSGKWGWKDIFKVIGWMNYLNISKSAFFVKDISEGHEPEFVNGKINRLGSQLIHLSDFSQSPQIFSSSGFPDIIDDISLTIWRYSCWLERAAINKLINHVKHNPSEVGPKDALKYHRLVNDSIFFMSDERICLDSLYDAYREHPRVALGIAREIEGHPYDPDFDDPQNKIIYDAMVKGDHELIHICWYIEHRARLAILKAAIDYSCKLKSGTIPSHDPNKWIDILFQILPQSFHSGFSKLSDDPFFHRYALFWQVLLWGFGGFLLEDREETEFDFLSTQTGIPIEEIPNALRAFDLLFPSRGGSWIVNPGNSSCTIVKLVPVFFRGLGAFQRRLRYNVDDYNKLGYTDFTANDLINWNNASVSFLTS
jgi:hypothetical protein